MNIDQVLPPHGAEPVEPSHIQLIEDKVRALAKLRDDGMLTYEEFAAKKADLLAQL